jgi:hypothetical protein
MILSVVVLSCKAYLLGLLSASADEGVDEQIEGGLAFVLVEAGDDEAGGDLSSDEVAEGIAKLEGDGPVEVHLLDLGRQRLGVRVGDGMPQLQRPPGLDGIPVEHVHHGIDEAGEQAAAGSEDAVGLAPDGEDVVNEDVGDLAVPGSAIMREQVDGGVSHGIPFGRKGS